MRCSRTFTPQQRTCPREALFSAGQNATRQCRRRGAFTSTSGGEPPAARAAGLAPGNIESRRLHDVPDGSVLPRSARGPGCGHFGLMAGVVIEQRSSAAACCTPHSRRCPRARRVLQFDGLQGDDMDSAAAQHRARNVTAAGRPAGRRGAPVGTRSRFTRSRSLRAPSGLRRFACRRINRSRFSCTMPSRTGWTAAPRSRTRRGRTAAARASAKVEQTGVADAQFQVGHVFANQTERQLDLTARERGYDRGRQRSRADCCRCDRRPAHLRARSTVSCCVRSRWSTPAPMRAGQAAATTTRSSR